MSNITLDNNPIAQWACPHGYTPSDAIQLSKKEWGVFNSKNSYLSLNISDNSVEEKVVQGIDELVRIEKKGDNFLVVTYDSTTRVNNTWLNSSISVNGKEELGLDDAVDIFYSKHTEKLYWVYSSRNMFVYDFKTKTSVDFLADKKASDCCLSSNGQYLAIQDREDNIDVVNLDNNEIVTYKAKENVTRALVGVTDSGKLLVVNLHTAHKNDSNSPTNEVLLLNGEASDVILNINSGWAKLKGDNLIAWVEKNDGNQAFQLFDVKNTVD